MKTFIVVINDKLDSQLQAKNVFEGYKLLLSKETKGKIQLIEKSHCQLLKAFML
ncbi:MAG TPA: hypothetical protein PLP33_07435 [Leptospiraceae bacterium]|nr:hypothetical protein [Leptospiraceae bacterium]